MSLLRRISRHPVTHNALGMYGVTFAGYILPLVTLPYLARVLRPAEFGLLVFAQSFAAWTAMTVEYGFNLSATREIARNRENKERLVDTAAGVLGAKTILLGGLLVVMVVAGITVANLREHPAYLLWVFAQTLALGFSPFWYFQGAEKKMVGAVGVDLAARVVATAFVFVLVHNPADGWLAMALQAGAACASTLMQTVWMYREIPFLRPNWKGSIQALRGGWDMFLFRGAYNVYSTANAFILGLFASPEQVGLFGGAQRIARAAQGLTVPLAQAVYPQMSHLANQNPVRAARLARVTLLLNLSAGVTLALFLGVGARWVVAIGLGTGYEPVVTLLRIFAVFLPINAMNSALIMYWLLPLGLEKPVGRITMAAIVLNLTLAAILAPRFAHVGMAWVMVVAEGCKCLALVATLWRRSTSTVGLIPEESKQTV
jgi:polysaccharide transporter, PST family